MKKSELKNVLKPLIKECIKEVMFEDGTLSSIIAEVMKGTGVSNAQPIVENKKINRLETDQEARARLDERKKMLMSSISQDAYNNVNLFEGTTPAPADTSSNGQSALQGVSPNDPGVDISGFLNKTTAIWSKMNEKK